MHPDPFANGPTVADEFGEIDGEPGKPEPSIARFGKVLAGLSPGGGREPGERRTTKWSQPKPGEAAR